jgi:hypothetical protein
MRSLRMEMKAGFEKISIEIRDVRNDLKIHELEHHHRYSGVQKRLYQAGDCVG